MLVNNQRACYHRYTLMLMLIYGSFITFSCANTMRINGASRTCVLSSSALGAVIYNELDEPNEFAMIQSVSDMKNCYSNFEYDGSIQGNHLFQAYQKVEYAGYLYRIVLNNLQCDVYNPQEPTNEIKSRRKRFPILLERSTCVVLPQSFYDSVAVMRSESRNTVEKSSSIVIEKAKQWLIMNNR